MEEESSPKDVYQPISSSLPEEEAKSPVETEPAEELSIGEFPKEAGIKLFASPKRCETEESENINISSDE